MTVRELLEKLSGWHPDAVIYHADRVEPDSDAANSLHANGFRFAYTDEINFIASDETVIMSSNHGRLLVPAEEELVRQEEFYARLDAVRAAEPPRPARLARY